MPMFNLKWKEYAKWVSCLHCQYFFPWIGLISRTSFIIARSALKTFHYPTSLSTNVLSCSTYRDISAYVSCYRCSLVSQFIFNVPNYCGITIEHSECPKLFKRSVSLQSNEFWLILLEIQDIPVSLSMHYLMMYSKSTTPVIGNLCVFEGPSTRRLPNLGIRGHGCCRQDGLLSGQQWIWKTYASSRRWATKSTRKDYTTRKLL